MTIIVWLKTPLDRHIFAEFDSWTEALPFLARQPITRWGKMAITSDWQGTHVILSR